MPKKARLSEALDAEVKRALDFIEDRILPQARRDGEKLLRRISKELDRWADQLHDKGRKK